MPTSATHDNSLGRPVHSSVEDYARNFRYPVDDCRFESDRLKDIAETIAGSFTDEYLNDSYTSDLPETDDWRFCERLLPDMTPSESVLDAGYTDCMDEAIRFLIEEEDMGPDHPLVLNLRSHLEEARERILSSATQGSDVDNNNFVSVPSQNVSYDCYVAVNLVKNSNICNTG